MAETGLTIRFERSGRILSQATGGILDWEIESSYTRSTDSFSFSLYSENDPELTATELLLQPVELTVNGAPQGFFRIEVTDIGDDGTVVKCQGRDYISELVECNVDPYKKFTEDTELGDALVDVMAPVGIRTVTDFENVIMTSIRSGLDVKSGNKRKNQRTAKIKDFQPKPGEGIYECCNRLCARFGVTIQPSISRSDICLDAPDYAAPPLFKLVRTKDSAASAANNIVRGSASRNLGSFPTYAIFTGTDVPKDGKRRTPLGSQFSTIALAEALGLDELAGIMQRATLVGRSQEGDPNVLYRLLYFRDEDSKTQDQLDYAARRAMADRLRDTLSYSCTVKGHVDPVSGGVWSVGAMCEVSDAVTGVHENLWLASRKLRYSGDGPMTDLELIRPGTWAINEEL